MVCYGWDFKLIFNVKEEKEEYVSIKGEQKNLSTDQTKKIEKNNQKGWTKKKTEWTNKKILKKFSSNEFWFRSPKLKKLDQTKLVQPKTKPSIKEK